MRPTAGLAPLACARLLPLQNCHTKTNGTAKGQCDDKRTHVDVREAESDAPNGGVTIIIAHSEIYEPELDNRLCESTGCARIHIGLVEAGKQSPGCLRRYRAEAAGSALRRTFHLPHNQGNSTNHCQ